MAVVRAANVMSEQAMSPSDMQGEWDSNFNPHVGHAHLPRMPSVGIQFIELQRRVCIPAPRGVSTLKRSFRIRNDGVSRKSVSTKIGTLFIMWSVYYIIVPCLRLFWLQNFLSPLLGPT